MRKSNLSFLVLAAIPAPASFVGAQAQGLADYGDYFLHGKKAEVVAWLKSP